MYTIITVSIKCCWDISISYDKTLCEFIKVTNYGTINVMVYAVFKGINISFCGYYGTLMDEYTKCTVFHFTCSCIQAAPGFNVNMFHCKH